MTHDNVLPGDLSPEEELKLLTQNGPSVFNFAEPDPPQGARYDADDLPEGIKIAEEPGHDDGE